MHQLTHTFNTSTAADRLAQFDKTRRQWQERTKRWLYRYERLMAAAWNTDEAANRLERLRYDFFEPAELRRVKILESLHDQGVQLIVSDQQ